MASLTNPCGGILYYALVHAVGFQLVFALKASWHRHHPVSASSRMRSACVGRFRYSCTTSHMSGCLGSSAVGELDGDGVVATLSTARSKFSYPGSCLLT